VQRWSRRLTNPRDSGERHDLISRHRHGFGFFVARAQSSALQDEAEVPSLPRTSIIDSAVTSRASPARQSSIVLQQFPRVDPETLSDTGDVVDGHIPLRFTKKSYYRLVKIKSVHYATVQRPFCEPRAESGVGERYSMILWRFAYLLLRIDSSAQFSPCNNIEVTLGDLRARSSFESIGRSRRAHI
jgi:hypothetical protein